MTPKKKQKEGIAPILVGNKSSIDPNNLNLIYNCDIISLNGDEVSRDGEAPLCLEGSDVFSPIKGKGTIEHLLYSPIKVSKEKDNPNPRKNRSKNQVSKGCEKKSEEIQYIKIPDRAKEYGTQFSFEVFKHLRITKFRESDRGGRSKTLENKLFLTLGLSCRYCDGESGKKKGGRCGRYFPTSFKTFKDPNKIIFSVYRHLKRCQECPTDVIQKLDAFHTVYETERAAQKRGMQVKFYQLVWKAFREKEFENF
ncbi:hypothetical protein CTEN210_11866 [Chaetoceros tenuissimus]|uniref:Uncharacterized protein n=1 Tax=Chaetoceros tenuissimus TaxID=426638 RepID=A0AAD3D2L2_9STRA|nr:hypothetical protein CTEN210_11866 [Chaetoceros tenuissimus]